MKKYQTECSLEPVICEMSEFGCLALIRRKDVAKHMEENEGQHLMSLAILNYKQLHVNNRCVSDLQQNLQRLQQGLQHTYAASIDSSGGKSHSYRTPYNWW